jgi:vacuolar-type H+-ATPase subunit E/Vma4
VALEAFLDALERSADDDGRRLVESARAEADRLIAAARERARAEVDTEVARRQAELDASVDARLAEARLAASATVMEARARCLARIFGAAEARLTGSRTGEEAARTVPRLLDEALEFLPDMAVVVRCHASLEPYVGRAIVASRIGSVIAEPAIPWGVIVEAEDGSVRIDNTLVSRLRRRVGELSIAVLTRLEAGP